MHPAVDSSNSAATPLWSLATRSNAAPLMRCVSPRLRRRAFSLPHDSAATESSRGHPGKSPCPASDSAEIAGTVSMKQRPDGGNLAVFGGKPAAWPYAVVASARPCPWPTTRGSRARTSGRLRTNTQAPLIRGHQPHAAHARTRYPRATLTPSADASCSPGIVSSAVSW